MPHATAILIITPQGVPLIRDPKKPAPVYWKLPGGRSENNESAEDCILREVQEELGITLEGKDLRIIHQEDRISHMLTVFIAKLSAIPPLNRRGNEGEEIRIFSKSEIQHLSDFFPNHLTIVKNLL
jgi:ADP-ribose pyrophosphatase YjhB (NUDIX family)